MASKNQGAGRGTTRRNARRARAIERAKARWATRWTDIGSMKWQAHYPTVARYVAQFQPRGTMYGDEA